MSTADFDRAVRKEMRHLRRRRPTTQYGQDSRRRARARQDDALTKRTRTRLLAWIIVLIATAFIIIGWDHTRGPMNLPRPVEATDTTSTPAAHPGVGAR